MGDIRTFPLEKGSCYIHAEAIEIEQSELMPRIAHRLGGRKLLVNLLFAAILGLACLVALILPNYLLASFFAAMSAFYLFLAWAQRDISYTKRILKSQVVDIHFQEAVPGESKSQFVIWFAPKGTRTLRRILPLASRNEQDRMIAQSALQIMREENLIS